MWSPFLHFALGRSQLPENSILLVNRPFSARFPNCCNSLNFEAKINFNTTRQNDLKWRKTSTGLKFDLEHFNGPQTKFIGDSLYKHPVQYLHVSDGPRVEHGKARVRLGAERGLHGGQETRGHAVTRHTWRLQLSREED